MATTPVYGLLLPTVAADSGIWGGENNTLHNGWDAEIARLRVPFLTPTYNVGGTTTLDCSQTTGARVHLLTVSGASTLAFSGVPSASFDCKISLIIVNGSAFVLTFPASVTWLAGVAPVLKASGVDIVDLETKDGGATWYGSLRSPKSPIVLYRNYNLTTTSTSDTSVASYSLPANTLAAVGSALRITCGGITTTQNASANIQFGATVCGTIAIAVAAPNWFYTGTVIEVASNTQIENGSFVSGSTAAGTRNSGGATVSGAITIDFRGSVTAGGTLHYDFICIELLPV